MNPLLKEVWARIESWDADHPPSHADAQVDSRLSVGASLADLMTLQESIQLVLPDDVSESLRTHNGLIVWDHVFMGSDYLSTIEIAHHWHECVNESQALFDEYTTFDASGPVKAVGWHKSWIPLFKRNKELICIDMAPAHGGRDGQVIEVDWEGGQITVIASSLLEFLIQVDMELQRN